MLDELIQRLFADAERYDVAAHTRSLLAPYRHVLLLARAKFMSYEQLSVMLAVHGINVSPTAIGVFCRRNFTKADIERIRRERAIRPSPTPQQELPGITTTNSQPPPPPPAPQPPAGGRGPKIARDDF